MDIFSVISLFGGLAMFLYGMRLMGNSLRESSSGAMKAAMEKVTNNLFKSFLLGLLVTALIQSSTATIVITSGLVAAGMIPLKQSVGIIIGANVGTTVTGQIIRLLDIGEDSAMILQFFKPAVLAPIALIIGIIMIMCARKKKTELIGSIVIGFGILFSGLVSMTDSVSSLAESDLFMKLFTGLEGSPLLGYLAGAGVAFVLQSSSATIGILQALSTTGNLTFQGIYAVLVGIYLGDCVTTAIVCGIGQKSDGKRVGVIHVLFNLSETLLILLGVTILHKLGVLDSLWNSTVNSGAIANTNTVFNLVSAIVLFPVAMQYEKLSRVIVKDEQKAASKYQQELAKLNPNFYKTPAFAFNSCYDVMKTMFQAAYDNICLASDLFREYDEDIFDKIQEEEENIDLLADQISQYLAGLSPYIKEELHTSIMTQYYRDITEFERLGDHAVNISEEAKLLHEQEITFSEEARHEITVLESLVSNVLVETRTAFYKRDIEAAARVEPLEQVVDDMIDTMEEHHLQRMGSNICDNQAGSILLNFLGNMERISDICSNIGISVLTRAKPELLENEHSYLVSLHLGNDEEFNKAYQAAHDKYFGMLDKTEE